MIKLRVIEIGEYNNYILVNGDDKYNLVINFYGSRLPKVGDFIYLPVKLVKEVNIYNFGPVNEKYTMNNISEEEVMKVVTEEEEYYLQRYYG